MTLFTHCCASQVCTSRARLPLPAFKQSVELKVHLKRGVRPASWLREWAYISALEEGLHLAQELPIVQTEGQILAPLVPRLQVS